MENWYVYYALSRAQRADMLPRLRAMQRDLAASSDVSARLEHRVRLEPNVEGEAAPTIMEVYEGVADPERFADALAAAVAAAGFAPELRAARRLERFQPL